MMKIIKFIAFSCLFLSLDILAAPALSKEDSNINCWHNDRGNLICGDFIPPEEVKKEITVYDTKGQIKAIKEKEKTPEEYQKAEEEKKEAEKAKKEAETQKKYDEFLINTYDSPNQLLEKKKLQSALFDDKMDIIKSNLIKAQRDLGKYNMLIEKDQSEHKEDKNLLDVKEATEKNVNVYKESIDNLEQQKEATLVKIDTDITRLEFLLSQKK